MKQISYEEFASVELRSGTITKVEAFTRASNPSYKIWADFGPELGIKQSSAQVTQNYSPEQLVGRQIIGCVNLGIKNIAGFMSEFLLVGFSRENGSICLAGIDPPVQNGQKMH